MGEYDDKDIEKMVDVILEDHLKYVDKTIRTDGNSLGSEYDYDNLIPIFLKQIRDTQITLKKSQDKLNVLTIVLVVCTIVLALLTVLLYFKG